MVTNEYNLHQMERIASRHNPLVKRFRDLARLGAADDAVLLDGQHLLEEAIAAEVPIDVAAFSETHARERLHALAARTGRLGARTITVTDQVLAAISPVQHPSGVVAIARRPATSLEQVFARLPQLVVLLSDVQDPGNVGAIVRAAEGCGASGLVAGAATADPFGWKALRGAMGSTFRLPLARARIESALVAARAHGLRVFATVPRGGTPLPACDLRGPSGILLGGEGGGLPKTWVDSADQRVTIPMRGQVESLNVAIAAALVLYEASRQRGDVPLPHPR
jgi:TrmH family RNA methyltransferase